MTNEQAELLMLKGLVATMPAEIQARITAELSWLRQKVADCAAESSEAHGALLLALAQIVLESGAAQ